MSSAPSPRRRRTDRQLWDHLETYPRGEVLLLMLAPQAVYWAGSDSLLAGLAGLFVLVYALAAFGRTDSLP